MTQTSGSKQGWLEDENERVLLEVVVVVGQH